MTQPKTTLIAGVGWPEVGEWPVRFAHKEKPKRVIKPKSKSKANDLCEAKVEKGVFQHPTQAEPRKELPPPAFAAGTLDTALKQVETGDTKSKHKHAIKNLKRPNLAPKEFFIFARARSSK